MRSYFIQLHRNSMLCRSYFEYAIIDRRLLGDGVGDFFFWVPLKIKPSYPAFFLSAAQKKWKKQGRWFFFWVPLKIKLAYPRIFLSAAQKNAEEETSNLVDPASGHMLASRVKPCMCKFKQSCNTVDGSLYQQLFIWKCNTTWISVVILELIHVVNSDCYVPRSGRFTLLGFRANIILLESYFCDEF